VASENRGGVCHLPSAICHLPSAICHLPSAICHLPSAIDLLATSNYRVSDYADLSI